MRINLATSIRATRAAAVIVGLAALAGACRTASALAPEAHRFQTGVASWYGPGFHGRMTSNRETYDMYDATAAHNSLPFGTRVRVTNLDNGKSAIVRINDRGPFVGGRIIDLSYSAAYLLDMLGPGTAPVSLDILDRPAASARATALSVQAGAFSSRDRAWAAAETLAAEFPRVRVVEVEFPEGIFYRVRIPAENRLEAEGISARLVERGVRGFIIEVE